MKFLHEPELRFIELASHRPRLLLVDDDPTIRAVFAQAADEYFALDVIACSGVDGARRELEADPDFAGALLDVRLTNGTGIELYREIVRRWPRLQIVFMTGFLGQYEEQISEVGPARVYPKGRLCDVRFFCLLLQQFGIVPHRCPLSPA